MAVWNFKDDSLRLIVFVKEMRRQKNEKTLEKSNTTIYIKKFRTIDTEDSKKLIGNSNELVHLHLKRGGKGKFVVFGITYESSFYILDMNHKVFIYILHYMWYITDVDRGSI